MRTFITVALALFASVVSANSKANPFNNPAGGYTFTAGQPTTLSWRADSGDTVTLRLQHGQVSTAGSGVIIASNIPNDGSFTWNVPSTLPYEPDYTIEIIDDSNPDNYNFSPRFIVSGAVIASTSVTTSTTTISTTSTTSATKTHTPTSGTPSTMTTTTSSSASSSSAVSTTSSSTSTTAASSTTSAASVPTTNAGMVNRVSGGLLAVVAGAAMML